MNSYSIGQIADASGFSASTLRYYEQEGLLEPTGRTEARYRIYDDGALDRLRFIARAKELGCTLDEIRELAALWADADCTPVQARMHELVTDKIHDARRRSTELVHLTAQLEVAASHLGSDPTDGPCTEQCACAAPFADTLPGPSTIPLKVRDASEAPIACTLPTDQVSSRIGEWSSVLSHALSREPLDTLSGVRIQLDSATPLAELGQLAIAEQGCCAFLSFTITVDERGLALEVRAPGDASELVNAVFGAGR